MSVDVGLDVVVVVGDRLFFGQLGFLGWILWVFWLRCR